MSIPFSIVVVSILNRRHFHFQIRKILYDTFASRRQLDCQIAKKRNPFESNCIELTDI